MADGDSSATRRTLVRGALLAATTASIGASLTRRSAAAPPADTDGTGTGTGTSTVAAGGAAAAGIVATATPERLRADVRRMVDCGPRLPGWPGHDEWCTWLTDELAAAGLRIEPCEEYTYDSYQPADFALEILDGPGAGPVEVATSYVRSAGTSAQGVTGPLVLATGFPTPSQIEALIDPAAVTAAIRAWVAAVPAGSLRGTVLLVDLPAPGRLTANVFTAISAYLQWDGHDEADWAQIDYSRLWLGPWPDLNDFAALGLAGVVFTTAASRPALRGNYSSHTARPQPLPALVVDREVGARLRERAAARPRTRLTLISPVRRTRLRQITAVLPGESDECVIVNTHTDGQNAFEENGGVAAVALARHFAALPPGQRLRRTLVFALYPGHMSGRVGIENSRAWILRHPDLVRRAVGAVSIEHLGATEWIDDPARGYHASGENELYAIWTTQGPTLDTIAKPALVAAGLQRHALLKPPLQITPGAPFHKLAGVPHVSGIAGPSYLVVVSPDGELEKFDADLAAAQVGFYADVVGRFDTADRAALRTGDPTLGQDTPTAEERTYRDEATTARCAPATASAARGAAADTDSEGPLGLPGPWGYAAGAVAGAAALAAGGFAVLRTRRHRRTTPPDDASPSPSPITPSPDDPSAPDSHSGSTSDSA
ncbi:hypothetical protein MXD59_24650 [Frankia sp. Ag45/Mut15]|uniref:Peptidase M28 domain-containing protein n=1 Tax=Frankia umida TaxID=573489 RepID=A0ABT0K542_9ACTN|nr:hypothetical protein [Frankia umida]MCK9878910.1 hypothetical protein [Frankia umida]